MTFATFHKQTAFVSLSTNDKSGYASTKIFRETEEEFNFKKGGLQFIWNYQTLIFRLPILHPYMHITLKTVFIKRKRKHPKAIEGNTRFLHSYRERKENKRLNADQVPLMH